METYKIQGVEIFSAGTWNGDEYSLNDLKGMVDVFEMHKKAVRPFLKLGHDENQQLLQNDGLPAAGWIDRVYIVGEKLLADFIDIPKKVFELIQNKAYRKVSSEIYWNLKIGDIVHKHMLGAVALLGADTPGVMNLNDILGMYKKQGFEELKTYAVLDEVDTRTYQITANLQGEDSMSTEERAKLEADLKAEQEKAAAQGTELDVLKLFKAEAEKKSLEMQGEIEKFRKEASDAKLAKYIADLKSEKLITPAMEPLMVEFLGPDKKEYTLADKQVSKEDLLKELLKLHSVASTVNLEENSVVGKPEAKDKDAELEKEATALSKAESIPYGQALKRLFSSKQQN